MPLDLGVNEGCQHMGSNMQVDVDELSLLVQAKQGEIVPKFHGQDGVLLLKKQIR